MPAPKGLRTNRERFAPELGARRVIKLGLSNQWQYFPAGEVARKEGRAPVLKEPIEHPNVMRWKNLEVFNDLGWCDWWAAGNARGVYPNADLTQAQYDAIFIKSGLSMANKEKEATLMKSKWFDYRFMHFIEANYLFVRHYQKAHGEMMQKIHDYQKGQYLRGFNMSKAAKKLGLDPKDSDDFMLTSEKCRMGLWKARRLADSLGIPYWFYNQFAMKWAVEDQIWQRPPKPVQLYKKEMIEEMVPAWEDRLKAGMVIPVDERYTMKYWQGSEQQQDFQVWLCGRIRSQAWPEYSLKTYLFDRPMLTMENAIEHVGEQYVVRAQNLT